MREMIGAILVLVVIVGVLVTVTRSCSFDPGPPAADRSSAPSVDASAKLREAAGTVSFPVRQPVLPRSWHANSSSTSATGSGAGANVVVRVGWLTPGGRYTQLSQSGGAVPDVLATETGGEPDRTGSVEAGGVSWATYPSRREEVAWVASLDHAVVLITGNGTESEFRALARAVTASKPIPR
jgi:uncharacterized protein DUF4245